MASPRDYSISDMLKAQQWERTKGELRALVGMQGSISSRDVGDTSEQKWERLEKRVEEFIASVEDDGLNE